MIGKLLLTLLVIALAVLYLRKRYQQSHQKSRPISADTLPVQHHSNSELEQFLSRARTSKTQTQPPRESGAMATRLKTVLWGVLCGLLLAGSTASYLYWQDQQRLVTVLLHRNINEAPVIYRVEKRNLGDGEFITVGGTRVTVSANERMEVVGL